MYHFDWIKRHAERTPDKLALVDAHTEREYTYLQFNERANRLASFLKSELGIQQGDRVSLLAQNSSDYFAALFACGKMGAILNTLNWRLAVPELEFILNDCAPRVLVYESIFAEVVEALQPLIDCEFYVVMGDESPAEGWTYEGALAAGSAEGVEMPPLKYTDTWAILYTSGTTGRPKGAQVTYGNFFYNAVGMGRAIDLTANDVNLNMLPTFHAGGLGLYAGPILHAGGTLVVMRAFEPGEFLRLLEGWQVTVVLLVPSVYLMLSQFPDFRSYDQAFSKVTGRHVIGARTLSTTEAMQTQKPAAAEGYESPRLRTRAASDAYLAGAGYSRQTCHGCGAILSMLFYGEIGLATVDVRRQHLYTQAAALSHGAGYLLCLVCVSNEESRHVFNRVVCFEIGSLVGNKGVANTVSLVEGIARKGFNEGEDLIGHLRRESVFLSTCDEVTFFLFHYLRNLFAHCLAEDIGLP